MSAAKGEDEGEVKTTSPHLCPPLAKGRRLNGLGDHNNKPQI